jgi:hypothetical protein
MKKLLIVVAIFVSALLAPWMLWSQKAKLEIQPEVGQRFIFSLDYVSDANAPSSFTTWSDSLAGTQSVSIALKGEMRYCQMLWMKNFSGSHLQPINELHFDINHIS